jgi:lysozyme family protein
MASFDIAWTFMIPHEDSHWFSQAVVTTDNDGGKVRLGLNSRAHPDLIEKGFYEMPVQQAVDFAKVTYNVWYWTPLHGAFIRSQYLANRLFDQSVPMGPPNAIKQMQEAINVIAPHALVVDGYLGPKTMSWLNQQNDAVLVDQFRIRCMDYYQKVLIAHPEYDQTLLTRVWKPRLYS